MRRKQRYRMRRKPIALIILTAIKTEILHGGKRRKKDRKAVDNAAEA